MSTFTKKELTSDLISKVSLAQTFICQQKESMALLGTHTKYTHLC